MAILKKIGDFLFGKDPEIFDANGKVLHKLPKRKWDDWQNRYIKGDDYNWRSHSGVNAGSQNSNSPKKSN